MSFIKNSAILASSVSLVAGSFLAWSSQPANAQPIESASTESSLSVLMGYIPDVEDYGYEYALHQGMYSAQGLHVKLIPGASGVNPIQEVEAGAAQVGIATGSTIIAAVGSGAKLEVFGAEFETSPGALTCRQDSGVKSIAQLKGKTIGVKQGNEQEFNFFLSENGLKASEVTQVPIGDSDLSEIIAGKIQCEFPSFAFNEPQEIEDQGVKVRVFPLSEHGVPDIADAFFVSKSYYDNRADRDTLIRFLKASAQGWLTQFKNPVAAAKWEVGKRFVQGLNLSQQEYQAREQVIYMKSALTAKDGLLATEPATWKETAKELYAEKITKTLVNTGAFVTNALVIDAHTPKL